MKPKADESTRNRESIDEVAYGWRALITESFHGLPANKKGNDS
jgi:hypothetical protein